MYKKVALIEPHYKMLNIELAFYQPYPTSEEVRFLSQCVMKQFKMYVDPVIQGYAKFTVTPTIITSSSENVTFTAGASIPLTTQDGKTLLSEMEVFSYLCGLFHKLAEK